VDSQLRQGNCVVFKISKLAMGPTYPYVVGTGDAFFDNKETEG